jgi:hypothetical protein
VRATIRESCGLPLHWRAHPPGGTGIPGIPKAAEDPVMNFLDYGKVQMLRRLFSFGSIPPLGNPFSGIAGVF